jgi:outer membrane protein assembly factor BamB
VAGVAVGGAAAIVLVGAQDGYVHLLDATTGAQHWPAPPASPALGAGIQGAPAALFTAFGGAFDYVLVGTRNTGADNAFYALTLATGAVAGSFTNGGGANRIGPVHGGASVDYPTSRVYFTSRAGGSPNTLWCFELGAPPNVFNLKWAKTLAEVGEFDASPVLRNGRVYVANLAGVVHSLDAITGLDLRSFATADGPVKGFVFPDRRNDRLYFATDRKVFGVADTPGGFVRLWNEIDLPTVAPADPGRLPSAALYAPGTDLVYVGAGDGRLWQIDASAATLEPDVPPILLSVALGDGASLAGAPSRDSAFAPPLVYVGTAAGVIYAVETPLP